MDIGPSLLAGRRRLKSNGLEVEVARLFQESGMAGVARAERMRQSSRRSFHNKQTTDYVRM